MRHSIIFSMTSNLRKLATTSHCDVGTMFTIPHALRTPLQDSQMKTNLRTLTCNIKKSKQPRINVYPSHWQVIVTVNLGKNIYTSV